MSGFFSNCSFYTINGNILHNLEREWLPKRIHTLKQSGHHGNYKSLKEILLFEVKAGQWRIQN